MSACRQAVRIVKVLGSFRALGIVVGSLLFLSWLVSLCQCAFKVPLNRDELSPYRIKEIRMSGVVR
jgi:hypothetical protein